MMLRNTLFIALLTIIGCSSTPEQVATTPEPTGVTQEVPTIRFGSSHGMCMGYCTREFEVKGDALLARRKGGGRGDLSAYPDQEQVFAVDKASITAALAAFDANLFDAAPDTIGCPDCADGGRCWVEVTRDGQARTVAFDCHGGSDQLKPFTDALWQLAEQVKWADEATEGQ